MKDEYDFKDMKTGDVDIPDELFKVKPVVTRKKGEVQYAYYINPIQRFLARVLAYLKGLFSVKLKKR